MFSVVIPLFNKRVTVRRAIESVLAQSNAAAEIIVVNDGSTDGGEEGLESLSPLVQVINQQNEGEGPARNRGVAASHQDWIALLDADDFWLPTHLEELSTIRRACPDAGLIGTAFAVQDDGRIRQRSQTGATVQYIDYFDWVGHHGQPFCSSSAAVRKSSWRQTGGFGNFRRGPDTEFWVRMALHHQVANSTRITSVYDRNPTSMSVVAPSRWSGTVLNGVSDLTPAVATILTARTALSPDRQRALDAFVYRNALWCLRASAQLGDTETLRSLARIFPGKPSAVAQATMIAASLPRPISKPLCRALSRVDVRLGGDGLPRRYHG